MAAGEKPRPVRKQSAAEKANAPAAKADYAAAFLALREAFADVLPKLQVLTDTEREYTLHTQVPSPLKQHKGMPMYFGSVRKGKAYTSFHLFPLYVSPETIEKMSAELKKRMQGKTCFNFKSPPEPQLLTELKKLTSAGLKDFEQRGWA